MAQKVVLWFGPVSLAQARRATIADADVFVLFGSGCPVGQGDPKCQGSTYFSNLIEKYNDGSRYLPRLLASKGVPIGDVEVYIGSFSAGHGAVKKLCLSDDDRALIQVVALADSTYCGQTNGVPDASEGYVRFAVDAVSHPKLFVASASSNTDPAGITPPGTSCMAAIKTEVERRVGMRFSETGYWPATDPAPNKVYQLGNCILADFGATATHPQHATVLAPQIWPQLVAMWLEKPQECMAAAVVPTATQGFGDATGCTMWGRVPVGGVPDICQSKTPRVIVESGGDVVTGLLAFGAASVGAYAALRLAQRALEAR